ncbi:MAG: DUF262 domain-containing protein [Promethearchaeota archaeon]
MGKNSMNLNANEENFLGLIENNHFKVPDYQRDYSWGKHEIDELTKDLDRLLEEKITNHFMGFIIATDNGENNFELIDGQQRLSTLVMLLSIIRDKFTDINKLGAANNSQRILIRCSPTNEKDIRIVIEMNENDRKFYRDLVYDYPDIDNEKTWIDFKKQRTEMMNDKKVVDLKSEEKIRSIYKKLDKYLKDKLKKIEKQALAVDDDPIVLKEDFLRKLRGILYEKLGFVFTTASSMEDAYTLFETLNDRGANLTLADLLKNFTFKTAKKEGCYTNVKSRWDDMINKLDPEYITGLVRIYWISAIKKVSAQYLFKEVRKYLQDKNNGFKSIYDFVDALYYEARNYNMILHPEEYSCGNKSNDLIISRYLGILKLLNIKQVYPMLLSVMKSQNADLLDYIKLLVVFSFRFATIVGKNPRDLEDFWSKRAREIRNNKINFKKFKELLLKENPSEQLFKESFEKFETKNHNLAKYILESLNNSQLGNKTKSKSGYHDIIVNPIKKETTLEHILPITTDNTKWEQIFIDEEHAKFVNKLGNMALLFSSENTSAQNSLFDEKITYYEKSGCPLTNKLKKYKEWNKETIVDNQKQYAQIAQEIWEI